MAELTFKEAVALVTARTGLADVAELLNDLCRRGRLPFTGSVIDHNQPIALDWIPDLDPDRRKARVHDNRTFQRADIDAWLAGMLSGVANSATPAAKRPRKTKWDWEAYKVAYDNRVAEMGEPCLTNVDGWQTQADVERWLTEIAEKDTGETPAEITARRYAGRFINAHEPS